MENVIQSTPIITNMDTPRFYYQAILISPNFKQTNVFSNLSIIWFHFNKEIGLVPSTSL